jgi:hypothetical protein
MKSLNIISIISFLLVFCATSAQPPQKIQMSDDMLDRLNEIESMYNQCINAGMNKDQAQQAALHWYEKRYPICMYPLPREDYKDSGDKKGKDKEKKKP